MKVSVCIPTYNQSQYLNQSIQSAFQQSLSPLEIIVSDDCSTDDTLQVLQRLSNEIPIIKIIQQPVNLGIAKNTDECLRAASGDYIIRLDSDDYLAPTFIQNLVESLLLYPNAGYAHASVQEVDQHGNMLRERKLARKQGFQTAPDALRAAMKGYRVAANIIMFRKEALAKVGYITKRPNYVEDFHLSASLAASGFGNVYIDTTLAYYRVWIDANKARQRRKLSEILGLYKVFEEVLEPAFRERRWNLSQLDNNRTALACKQADCLGWDVYTKEEKQELARALNQLSSSKRAKLFSWFYINGLSVLPNLYHKFNSLPKTIAKKVLYRSKA